MTDGERTPGPAHGGSPHLSGRSMAWRLARRYLASRSGRGLVSITTLIAVGSIALGVLALIVVIGVLTGMQDDLRDRILAGGPHGVVFEIGSGSRMSAWPQVRDRVREDPDVSAAAPFVYTNIILSTGDSFNQTTALRGMAPGEEALVTTGLNEHLILGSTPFAETESGHPGITVGRGLADRLGLYEGKLVVAASLENAELTVATLQPRLRRFEVVGIFETGLFQYDSQLAFVPIDAAQDLLGLGEGVTGIEFDVTDPWIANEVAERLEIDLDYPYRVDAWQDLNGDLFAALLLEKLALAVVLTLIILVASFNIVSTLVMVVAEKTREIGILRSMGMTTASIRRVFLNMGIIIGLVGTALGGVGGLVLAWLQNRYHLVSIPAEVYNLSDLPVKLAPMDVGLIVLGSILISFLATLLPSKRAAELTPVDAIRHE